MNILLILRINMQLYRAYYCNPNFTVLLMERYKVTRTTMLQNAVTHIEPTHSISSQLSQAGVLMGVGMLSVFLFLSLLIIAMFMLAKLVQRFPNSEDLASKAADASNPIPQSKSEPSSQIVAAISAAITQHQGSK